MRYKGSSYKGLNLKGLLLLCGGLALIVLGVWFTQNQAAREQQWNLEREAARGAVPGESRRDAASSMTGGVADGDVEGVAEMLP